MTYCLLSDRALLWRYLIRSPALHAYAIGDLDDFFFPDTRWSATMAGGEIEALAP